MKEFKTGDKVVHSCTECGTYAGTLEITEDHFDDKGNCIEGDLHLVGGGSISPVALESCNLVNDDVFDYIAYLEKIRLKIGKIAEDDLGMMWNEG